MRCRARTLAALAAVTLALGTAPAAAQDPAAAQALFAEGKQLMAAGRFVDACPKLAESQRLDPGMGTLFNLADCEEHVGRTASAWAAFLDVAAQARAAGQTAREKVARDRAAALAAELPHLRIDVVAGARVPGLAVRRDDADVGAGQWGSAIPVDPGEHAITARAPGKREWATRIRVAAGGATVVVAVPVLEDAAAAAFAPPPPHAASPPAPLPHAAPQPAAASPSPSTEHGLHPRRVVALVGGGAALVACGFGGLLAAQAMSKNADSNADGRCVGNRCTDEGVRLRNDARSAGDVASVAFVAGGVLAAAGVVLWLTAPAHAGGVAVRAAPTASGAVLHGSF